LHELRPGLDRFVLSTGHSAIALFAALHELGEYTLDELRTYGADGSRIEESPLEGTPGFDITGGSLGQGLSQAVGLALGARLHGGGGRVYCLLSDGELQEGQVWEAAMSAAHYRLDNLVVLVDDNAMQADGDPADVMAVQPIDAKLEAFGLAARRVDGNDVDALLAALAEARAVRGRPAALVCRTVPGRGAPIVEARGKTHYVRADDDFWRTALEQVGGP
jgi:transketolase